jgi:hypothetical protein
VQEHGLEIGGTALRFRHLVVHFGAGAQHVVPEGKFCVWTQGM